MDREAWWATVHRVTKGRTLVSDWPTLSLFHFHGMEISREVRNWWGPARRMKTTAMKTSKIHKIIPEERRFWPMSSREYGTISQRKIISLSLFLLTLTLEDTRKLITCQWTGRHWRKKSTGSPTTLIGLGKKRNLNLNVYWNINK